VNAATPTPGQAAHEMPEEVIKATAQAIGASMVLRKSTREIAVAALGAAIAAQESHAVPESDAEVKLTAIRTHCERKAAEFSADMFAVRPQDIRVNAGDILAIIDGTAL
jgi:hypothetical protein